MLLVSTLLAGCGGQPTVFTKAGVAGAAVAAGAIFLPSFVLLMSILPWLERFRALKWVRAAMRGVSPAVVGAIALTVVHLAPTAARRLGSRSRR